jgi:hypothetical protein
MVGRPFLGGLTVFLFSISKAWGQSSYSTHLDYDANAQTNGFGLVNRNETNSLDDSNGGYLTASDGFEQVESNDTAYFGHTDDAIVSYYGFADVGGVGASISGVVTSQTPGYAMGYTSAEADASVDASWVDFAEMYYPDAPVGEPYIVHASLRYHGTYSAAASGTILANQHFATWNIGVTVSGLDALDPKQNGTLSPFKIFESGGINSFLSEQEVDYEIPISFEITNGTEADAFGTELSITGSATAQTGNVDPTEVTSDFVGDFKDTLAWGGITSVTDVFTGQDITGYTFTSGSGFDYTKPYPVPEPCSVAGTLFGSALLLRRHRRLNSRP